MSKVPDKKAPDAKIPDADIPKADPAAVVRQYSPFVRKLAGKYSLVLNQTGAIDFDDLYQVGCIALLSAQKTYKPEEEKSFLGWSALYIKNAMRRELGFKNDGTLPAPTLSLDEPMKAEEPEGETRLDLMPDPNGQSPEEKAVEDSAREETRQEVNAAVDRLKDDRQRQIIPLKVARFCSDLSIKEAAEAINVLEATLRRWESGETSPTMEKLLSMSRVYGLPLDNFEVSREANQKTINLN